MTSLTTKEHSFIAMMARSDEHARKGFELILKRPDFPKFFDTLIERGFFDSSKNPAPVPAQPDGYVRIPYWKALDYLKACAKMSGHVDNAELADRVMAIVRTVSTESKCTDSRDNHYTFWAFAEIIGFLPVTSLACNDLRFVEVWLQTKYDRSLVADALDEGALSKLLRSDDPRVWRKAVQLLRYCTAIRWKPSRLDPEAEEPTTAADEYYVKEMIDHHAAAIGKKIGHEAARLLAGRVAEVFGRGGRAKWSHVFRPAVEDDDQNVKGASVDCVVEGLRDVLLGWCDDDVRSAKPFVKALLHDQNEMLRRIGIFVVNRRWAHLKQLYLPVVSPDLFDLGHLHELYVLLRDRFEAFSDEEKEATVEAIRGISERNTDANRARDLVQLRWLSAVAGTSYEPASKWLAELTNKHGPVVEHTEYLSFTEMRLGHGPSRYSAEELIALADDGTIVDKLRAFRPGDPWYGPTVRALIDEIQRAVEAAPDRFTLVLPDFLEAPRSYQYALLQGFWRLLNLDRGVKTTTPTVLWGPLFNFFEQLLRDPGRCVTGRSDSQEVPRSSICDAIADLILSGTRDGADAYPACLLPRAWSLIEVLVERGESIAEPSEDPMRQAINSSKGRALDAAFSHILRRFRNFDETPDSHASVWTEVRPFLDRQLDQCAGTNFEFSTLCGTHIRNLQFLDAGWLNERVRDIFPVKHPGNFRSALAGLAYAAVNPSTYQILRDTGIMDGALRLELKSRYSREKLLETLALAYLWGEETLESPRFKHLFTDRRTEDFESINHFLPTIRDSSLDSEQVERVVDYWRRCVDWTRSLSETPANLLSSLSGLTVFLTTADGNLDLLIPVAAHVHVHRNAYEFVRELNRLVKVSPCAVRTVVGEFIDTHEPFYDYKNEMQTLVRALAERGFRKDAIDFCNKLRSMPSMEALYKELMP